MAKAKEKKTVAPVVRASSNYVRGLSVPEARTLLRFSTRGAAIDIDKLVASAAANAEANHDLIGDDLRIAEITVDDGPTLKRWRARARGRATRIDKRTCHVKVALTPTQEA